MIEFTDERRAQAQQIEKEAQDQRVFFNLPKVGASKYVVDTASIDETKIPSVQLGIKHDSGKAGMSLLSRVALEETAKVLDFGKNKYAAHNWRNGFEWSRPLSAAMRHIMAFNDGEDKDPESGLSHLAHAACCIMFLLEFEKTHPELDDRWKPTK